MFSFLTFLSFKLQVMQFLGVPYWNIYLVIADTSTKGTFPGTLSGSSLHVVAH